MTRPPLVLVAIPAALLGVSLGLGKIVRDCSLTCNVGYELAPVAILAVAVMTLPFAALRARVESRWSFRRWQWTSTLAAAGSLLAFRALTYVLLTRLDLAAPGTPEHDFWTQALAAAYLFFYVWLGALTVLLAANVYAPLDALVEPGHKERALAAIAVAAVVGGLLGSALAKTATSGLFARQQWRFEVVRDHLMVAMALALLLNLPVVELVHRRLKDRPAGARKGAAGSLSEALALVRAEPGLRRMALLPFVGGMASTMVSYLFYWLISEQTRPDASTGRTLYFAGFYVWLNAASLLLLAFGTHRIIQRIGLVVALLSLPLALSVGGAWVAGSGLLAAMYALRVLEAALMTSLYGPALERLYLTIDEGKTALVRPVLTGLVARAGEGLGALLVLVLTFGLHVSLRAMLVLYLVLLAAWAAGVLALRATRVWDRLPAALN